MTNRLSADDDTPAIATKEDAAVTAYDALSAAGCDAVVTSLPQRTRSTWIVPATSEESTWRVHIDPRTGKTRIVETPE